MVRPLHCNIQGDFYDKISHDCGNSDDDDLLLSSVMMVSQSSKHSPQGTQWGMRPVVPRAHLSHLCPPTPAIHSQLPVLRSHCSVAEPTRSQSQPADRNTKYYYNQTFNTRSCLGYTFAASRPTIALQRRRTNTVAITTCR